MGASDMGFRICSVPAPNPCSPRRHPHAPSDPRSRRPCSATCPGRPTPTPSPRPSSPRRSRRSSLCGKRPRRCWRWKWWRCSSTTRRSTRPRPRARTARRRAASSSRPGRCRLCRSVALTRGCFRVIVWPGELLLAFERPYELLLCHPCPCPLPAPTPVLLHIVCSHLAFSLSLALFFPFLGLCR